MCHEVQKGLAILALADVLRHHSHGQVDARISAAADDTQRLAPGFDAVMLTWVLRDVLKFVGSYVSMISLPFLERERERECRCLAVCFTQFQSDMLRESSRTAGQASQQLQGLLHGLQFFWL